MPGAEGGQCADGPLDAAGVDLPQQRAQFTVGRLGGGPAALPAVVRAAGAAGRGGGAGGQAG
ncbi:hypothetical protein, partial [Streptomyces cacaoi]